MATSSVWNIHFKDSNNYKMALRIKELYTISGRTKIETKELKELLKIEKELLVVASLEENKWNSILNKISEFAKEIKDERLLLHFDLRLEEPLKNGLLNSVEDVEKIYHDMMEEDMEISKHEEMVEVYEQIKSKNFDREYEVPLDQEDFEYVYSETIDLDEEKYMMERLNVLRIAEAKNLSDSDVNKWLMLRVIRLERLVNEYYYGLDDGLDDENDGND